MNEEIQESKLYPFQRYRLYMKKRGICFICKEELYYGIGIWIEGEKDKDLCTECATKIKNILERI